MASISSDPKGFKRILFIASDGSRKAIRLGKLSMRQAESIKVKIEHLVTAVSFGSNIDDEVSRWVGALDDTLHQRLAAVDLVEPRERQQMTLGAFLSEYFAGLSVKPNTLKNYSQARAHLEAFFGKDKTLRKITPLDADQFRTWLKEKKLSQPTISKHVINSRSMFKRALKWKLISENPFADVRAGSQTNRTKMYFVTPEESQKVLDACPDAQWKALFALSRWGGLRCPSETLALKWGDIDWERNRLVVHSSKTEHHEGGETRVIPLFPELRSILLDAFALAEPGDEYVITRYRDTRQNLRTQLLRIIRKAKVKPWPRTFHNLRATRQTELAREFPLHNVCGWIGNSRAVAMSHYLQTTDADFDRAVGAKADDDATGDAKQAAQNPAQQTADSPCTVPHGEIENHDFPKESDECETVQGPKRSRQGSNL